MRGKFSDFIINGSGWSLQVLTAADTVSGGFVWNYLCWRYFHWSKPCLHPSWFALYFSIYRAVRIDDAELSHQLRLSEAKLVFTDAERLPLAKRAAQEVGISPDSVYLLEGNGKTPSLDDLLEHGELTWERMDQLEDLAQRSAHRSLVHDLWI